jgi:hypothetical protein
MTITVEQQIRDVVLVLNQIVVRQQRQGVQLSDEIGAAMTRLLDSLLTENERSSRRLEELTMRRSKLVVRRGELDGLKREQAFLLANPKGQSRQLLLLTRENAPKTAAAHAACVKELASVEAAIASTTAKTVRVKEFLR